jgi:hypothetical protein
MDGLTADEMGPIGDRPRSPCMNFSAMVFEDREVADWWRIERPEPPNGEDITLKIFKGPNAR